MGTRKINSWKAIIKDTKSFIKALLPETKIYVIYLSKEDIEVDLTETQAEILWEVVLGVTDIHQVHFIAPHANGIFMKNNNRWWWCYYSFSCWKLNAFTKNSSIKKSSI